MDVDRLMRDLTVEQLENIQQNLEKEMEGKRENLREMVGRRYRDVLEASSEVRNVCSLADKLAQDIGKTRISYQTTHIKTANKDEKKAGEHFYAVNYLISNIGSDDKDPLDDVVSFCIVEHLQKQLISNHSLPAIHKVARMLTERIVETQRELKETNIASLCDISRSDWATNQLTAVLILDNHDIDYFLDLYLEKRFEHISQLIEDSATILTIVDEIKKTLSVVEELFVHGELQHSIQSVCNGQYKCDLIREMCADQVFSFEKTIETELEKVWRHLREKLSGRGLQLSVSTQIVSEKCAQWIEKTCLVTHRLVAEVCEYFENLDQILELLQALTSSLRQDWPRIGPNRVVYEKLLQNVVVDKSNKLLIEMIEVVETSAKSKLESTNDGPSTSLFDERTYRADSQSHIGISTQFYECVKILWQSLEMINEKCVRFENICAPMADTSTPNQLKQTMANNVLDLLLRLCEMYGKKGGLEKCLAKARLAMALIHSDSSLVCTLLDKDSPKITTLNQRLHTIIDNNLSEFCKLVVDEWVSIKNLSEYLECFEGGMYALRLVMEFQTIELSEVGEVHIPIALSPTIHHILFEICCQISEASIGHLLTKKMRKSIGEKISNEFAKIFGEKVENVETWTLSTRSTLQILFDCQLLHLLFPGERMKLICSLIESHLDPFDVSLLIPLISSNLKLAYSRNQIIFASLLVDSISNKDVKLDPSYSKIQDLAVHIEQASRIPMIPRLDRTVMGGDQKRNGSSRIKNKYLTNPNNQGSSKSTPSLSAFYDRISSSWFGGANN